MGILHFHDADYFSQNALHNCELVNLDDMLQNGTVINGESLQVHLYILLFRLNTYIQIRMELAHLYLSLS